MRITALLFASVLAANAFAANWYSRGGYEKCMDTADGFLICREDYVNDFCYGKERVWFGYSREKHWYDRNQEKIWFDRNLIAVWNLNAKCEHHGWARFRNQDGSWTWKCYLNNREMKDTDCKGFRKR